MLKSRPVSGFEGLNPVDPTLCTKLVRATPPGERHIIPAPAGVGRVPFGNREWKGKKQKCASACAGVSAKRDTCRCAGRHVRQLDDIVGDGNHGDVTDQVTRRANLNQLCVVFEHGPEFGLRVGA